MHFEILVEEPSAEALLEGLIERIVPGATWRIHTHNGKSDLLRSLEGRLRGYTRWLPNDAFIVVLVDQDLSACTKLKAQLVEAGRRARISDRLLCRIAVEELEAWFLGDLAALISAFPGVPSTLTSRKGLRDPDAVAGGTWEALERALQSAGHMQGGLEKIRLARTMAQHMDVEKNESRSFRAFRDGLRRVAASAG